MPVGTCDPASRGDTWNSGQLTIDGGAVTVDYRYGWDGVSVRPDCVGPLNRVRVTNTTTDVTYYAHFKGRRGQPKVLEIPPGFVNTYNSGQLSSRGFEDNTDLEGLLITRSATPPADLAR